MSIDACTRGEQLVSISAGLAVGALLSVSCEIGVIMKPWRVSTRYALAGL